MLSYLGNQELLKKHKIGFLASRKISTPTVLPTLDWATEIAKRKDVAVVSGFHSPLERNVLKFLLRGSCSLIIVLHRGLYKIIPSNLRDAFDANRILFITQEKDNVHRGDEASCHRRNGYVKSISDELKLINMKSETAVQSQAQNHDELLTE